MSDSEPNLDYAAGGEPPDDLYRFDRTVNKRVPTIDDVGPSELGFFDEHGYLVVDQVLTDPEIQDAKDALTELIDDETFEHVYYENHTLDELDRPFETLTRAEKLRYVRKFSRFADVDDRLEHTRLHPEILDVVGRLVDGEPDHFQSMALIKPPGGREKPWHQDKAYFELALEAPVVGVWIALDAATADNGCMHILPDSHTDGPVPHFQRRDFQICDTDVQVDRDVMAPLEPGGVLFFNGLIHHGTPPNRTDSLRRALQYHYTADRVEWLDDGHPDFNADGKDVEC